MLIAVFVVLLAMGAPIDLASARLFSTMMLVPPSIFRCSPPAQNVLQPRQFCLAGRAVLRFIRVIMNSGELPPDWSILQTVYRQPPGSLSYTNIVGNMMSGALPDGTVASNLYRRRVMAPSAREGYGPRLCGRGEYRLRADGNVNSAHHGFLSFWRAGRRTSIAALFAAGGLVAECCVGRWSYAGHAGGR